MSTSLQTCVLTCLEADVTIVLRFAALGEAERFALVRSVTMAVGVLLAAAGVSV